MTARETFDTLFSARRDFFSSEASENLIYFTDDTGLRYAAKIFHADEKAPSIVFFPSCHFSLRDLETMAEEYTRAGINLLLLSYRADNSAEEALTLQQFLEDAEWLILQSLSWLEASGYTEGVFVMGQSLGAVAAIHVVEANPQSFKGLFVESVVLGTADFLDNFKKLPEDCERSEDDALGCCQKIAGITLPTFIFHGARDRLLPVTDAEKLQASSGARSKQFFVVPGCEHKELYKNAGPLYFQTIKKSVDTVCGLNTWRQQRKKFQRNKKKIEG